MLTEQQASYVKTIIKRKGIDVSEAEFYKVVCQFTASILLEQSTQSNFSSQPGQPDHHGG